MARTPKPPTGTKARTITRPKARKTSQSKPSTPGTAKSMVLNNTKSKATRPPKRQEYSQPYITPALKASLAKRPRRPLKSRQPGN
jgi:hypothetical protein